MHKGKARLVTQGSLYSQGEIDFPRCINVIYFHLLMKAELHCNVVKNYLQSWRL